jgi:DNA-binding MarR family transcriptional regulator
MAMPLTERTVLPPEDPGRLGGVLAALTTRRAPGLSSAGLVEPDRDEVADGRLRRYYRLTDEGATVLAAETERRRASAAVAAQRLSARLAGGIA